VTNALRLNTCLHSITFSHTIILHLDLLCSFRHTIGTLTCIPRTHMLRSSGSIQMGPGEREPEQIESSTPSQALRCKTGIKGSKIQNGGSLSACVPSPSLPLPLDCPRHGSDSTPWTNGSSTASSSSPSPTYHHPPPPASPMSHRNRVFSPLLLIRNIASISNALLRSSRLSTAISFSSVCAYPEFFPVAP
jgi:hypothetical protein